MVNTSVNPRTRFAFVPMLLALLSAIVPATAQLPAAGIRVPPSNQIWEAGLGDFSDHQYNRAVEAILAAFEQSTGRRLVPGEKGKVGLMRSPPLSSAAGLSASNSSSSV